jgi:DNA polymerase-3 subunit epsilon
MLTLFKRRVADYPKDLLDIAINEACYAVIDTELTGLDPKRDSIVSIGAIKMSGMRIKLGEAFYRLVKPQTALTSDSVVVHGITPSEVEEKPYIGGVIPELMNFCKGCVIVGHFIHLDLMFLNREIKRFSGQSLDNPAVDTYRIHDWVKHHNGDFSRQYGDDGEKDLFSLAKKYKIQVSMAHNALMDAFITAQLFQRFLSRLPQLGVRTVRDLLIIGRP